MNLKNIADLIDGKLIGDGELQVTGVSGIAEAISGDITYLSDTKLLKELRRTRASAVIVKEFVDGLEMPQIVHRNPQYAFANLLSHFHSSSREFQGISERAYIAAGAQIGDDVTIYPFAYIAEAASIGSHSVIYPGVFVGEKASVGEGCLIYANVTIREGITIGSRVIIHAGAVIGADGFGYVFEDGIHHKIPQVGTVSIEDDVEIGSNVTIDRATTGATVVGKGTKVDNLVQIGHNVHIGQNVILVAQVGIAGSAEIGDGVILAGQVGVADHAIIEAGTIVGAGTGVMGKLKQGVYFGWVAMPHRDCLKSQAVYARLPELKKKVQELELKMRQLEKD